MSYGIGPIGSRATARAALRQKAADFLDGRYRHPRTGEPIRKCNRCDGIGCKRCRQTGVTSAPNPTGGKDRG